MSHGSRSGGGALSQVAAKGVAWLMLQSLSVRVTGVLSQLLLARLLLPADFGVIALVYTVTNMAGVLANSGIDQVLLQRVRRLRFWAFPGLCTSLGLAIGAMLVILAAAPVAAHFYKSEQLVPLAAILSLSMPLGAFAMLPQVALRGALNFRFLAVYNVVEVLLTQLLTVFFAWRGLGAFSFVIPVPLVALLRVVVVWVRMPVPVRRRLHIVQVRYLASQGSAVFGNRVLTEAVANADYFILGLMASHTVVGLYFFAFRIAAQPMRMLAGNFSAVLFPALAQLTTQPERQLAAARSAAQVLAYAVMPLCLMQAALLEPALPLLFGDRWIDATPLIQILSVGLPFDAMSWVCGALLAAKGQFRRSLAYSCAFAPAFFAFIAIGAFLGEASGVAMAVSCFYVILAPLYSALTLTSPGHRLRQLFDLYGSPFALSALAVGGAYALSFAPILHPHPIARIAWIGLAGGGAYLLLMIGFQRGVLIEILARFKLNGLFRSGLLRRVFPAL